MADWDGAGYEQIGDVQRTMATRSLAGLVLRGDEDLLDVGCGDGFVTRALAARLPRGSVVGVDASPRMIDVALPRPDPPGARVRFEVCDVRDLPFRREFDVVVSYNTLHWVVDQRAALTSIAAATRPGGRVIVQFVCHGPRPSIEAIAMRVSEKPAWAPFFDGFATPYVHVNPAGYPALAASAGLVVTDLQVRDEQWDFGSVDAFRRWCAVGCTDWTSRLPAELVGDWVDRVVADYESTISYPGLLRFLQLRAELIPGLSSTAP